MQSKFSINYLKVSLRLRMLLDFLTLIYIVINGRFDVRTR